MAAVDGWHELPVANPTFLLERLGSECTDLQGLRFPHPPVGLPDVAWISACDGSRAIGDLEDQAARYHLDRHELAINADFRAITDPISQWQARYRGIAGARAVIEARVPEWRE